MTPIDASSVVSRAQDLRLPEGRIAAAVRQPLAFDPDLATPAAAASAVPGIPWLVPPRLAASEVQDVQAVIGQLQSSGLDRVRVLQTLQQEVGEWADGVSPATGTAAAIQNEVVRAMADPQGAREALRQGAEPIFVTPEVLDILLDIQATLSKARMNASSVVSEFISMLYEAQIKQADSIRTEGTKYMSMAIAGAGAGMLVGLAGYRQELRAAAKLTGGPAATPVTDLMRSKSQNMRSLGSLMSGTGAQSVTGILDAAKVGLTKEEQMRQEVMRALQESARAASDFAGKQVQEYDQTMNGVLERAASLSGLLMSGAQSALRG